MEFPKISAGSLLLVDNNQQSYFTVVLSNRIVKETK